MQLKLRYRYLFALNDDEKILFLAALLLLLTTASGCRSRTKRRAAASGAQPPAASSDSGAAADGEPEALTENGGETVENPLAERAEYDEAARAELLENQSRAVSGEGEGGGLPLTQKDADSRALQLDSAAELAAVKTLPAEEAGALAYRKARPSPKRRSATTPRCCKAACGRCLNVKSRTSTSKPKPPSSPFTRRRPNTRWCFPPGATTWPESGWKTTSPWTAAGCSAKIRISS